MKEVSAIDQKQETQTWRMTVGDRLSCNKLLTITCMYEEIKHFPLMLYFVGPLIIMCGDQSPQHKHTNRQSIS